MGCDMTETEFAHLAGPQIVRSVPIKGPDWLDSLTPARVGQFNSSGRWSEVEKLGPAGAAIIIFIYLLMVAHGRAQEKN